MYTSLIKGKVVLLKNLLYLVPSDRDGEFTIHVAPNKMSVAMDVHPSKGNGKKLSFGFIKSELLAQKIIFGIQKEVIQKIVIQVHQYFICLPMIVIIKISWYTSMVQVYDNNKCKIKKIHQPQ